MPHSRCALKSSPFPAAAAVAVTAPSIAHAVQPITPIQVAFLRWVEQQKEICRIGGAATDEEMEAACDRGFDIAQDMMDSPPKQQRMRR